MIASSYSIPTAKSATDTSNPVTPVELNTETDCFDVSAFLLISGK